MILKNLKPMGIASLTRWLIPYVLMLGNISLGFATDEDRSRIWVENPWEYRYIIHIESPSDYEGWKDVAEKKISNGGKINNFRLEPLFKLSVSIPTDPKQVGSENQAIGAIVVQFDRDGNVVTPNNLSLKLRGRFNSLSDIVLSSGNQLDSWWFHIGHYDIGRNPITYEDYSSAVPCRTDSCLPDDPILTAAFAPALCDLIDTSDYPSSRYRKGYAADRFDSEGNFGCREWGYYLQHKYIPYIDVTSYTKDKRTYIRPILGWGRFDVPPKPVIGKHGNVWVCLYECPNGDAPGIIPDIKQWATKNGWPVPKPPKKQPMFPDRQLKRGEFID